MRELCHKKTFFICLSLLFCSLFCLLFSSPASATNDLTKYWQVCPLGSITTTPCSLYDDTTAQGSFSVPIEILSRYSSATERERYLFGFRFWQQLNGRQITGNGSTVTAEFDVNLNGYQMYGEVGANVDVFDSSSSNVITSTQCSIIQRTTNPITGNLGSLKYRCVISDTNVGQTLSSIRITVGGWTASTNYFYYSNAATTEGTSGGIALQGFSYQIATQTSSADALLQTQIEQNQKIIEGQQQINDSVNNPDYIQQEKQDLQDAAGDAQDAADEYGDQAAQQGESLISIVSSFVTGLTQVEPSNCIIDVDLSLYRGGSHNNVDLCPMPKNSYVNTILVTVSGIIMAVWIIRAVIDVIQTMISMYKEYQE